MVAAGRARRHAAWAAPVSPPHPAAAAKAAPLDKATDNCVRLTLQELMQIACWNRPLSSGDTKATVVSCAPADWPPTVTLFGLPPNLAMLLCTHCSANC